MLIEYNFLLRNEKQNDVPLVTILLHARLSEKQIKYRKNVDNGRFYLLYYLSMLRSGLVVLFDIETFEFFVCNYTENWYPIISDHDD